MTSRPRASARSITSGRTPWARMTTAAPWSTSSSVSTVRTPICLEVADHALVVDDLAEGVGRLPAGGGLLGLVDRLAHAVAEAGALGDPDVSNGSHPFDYRTGSSDDPSGGGSASAPGAPYAPRWAGGRSAAIRPMIRLVAATWAARRSAPDPGALIVNGSPTRRTTRRRPGWGSRWPRGQTRRVPATPIGTIRAPVRRARIVVPSFASWSAPVGLRVPSGKTIRTWPSSRTRRAARNASTSAAPRSMPMTALCRMNAPTTGQSSASCLPSQWIRRPSAGVTNEPMSGASAFETWLATRRIGPSSPRSRSRPCVSTRAKQPPGEPPERVGRPDEPRDPILERPALAAPGQPSPPAPLPGRPDDRLDGGHRLLEGVPVGRDVDGVVGRDERGDRPVAVEVVAPAQVGQDGRRLGRAGIEAALLGPSPGALLGRGVEEDLEVGVGQHDRPDVAPGHDDPARGRERPLAGQERGPDLGHARDLADRSVDLGSADLVGHVDAVDRAPGRGARRRRARARPRRRAGRARPRSLEPDSAAEREIGQGAVEQPRVAEAVAEVARGGRPDAALARRGRPVEGDDQPGRARRARPPWSARRAPPRADRWRSSGRGYPAGAERPDLGRAQRPDGARAERPEADRPDPDPDEPVDGRARRRRTSGGAGASSPGAASPGTRRAPRRVGGSISWREAADLDRRSSAAGGWSVARPSSSRIPARSAASWSRAEGPGCRPIAYSRSTPNRGWRTRSAHAPSFVSRMSPSESWSSRPTG